jgi:hypothetical protein
MSKKATIKIVKGIGYGISMHRYKVDAEIEYTYNDGEYEIIAMRCEDGLPETIYHDEIYEQLDKQRGEDEGEWRASQREHRFDG